MDRLPKSARELQKSSEGRKILARYQKEHAVDIAQPGSPLFEKAWGKKVRKQEAWVEKKRREANDEWEALRELRGYERRRQIENFRKKYH